MRLALVGNIRVFDETIARSRNWVRYSKRYGGIGRKEGGGRGTRERKKTVPHRALSKLRVGASRRFLGDQPPNTSSKG